MRNISIVLVTLLFFLSSCYEDKGNYNYDSKTNYKIMNVPEVISVLANVEKVKFEIKVQDSVTNKYLDNSVLYFKVLLGLKNDDGIWTDINADLDDKVDTLAVFPADSYKLWIQAYKKGTDIRVASQISKLNVASITYEGWMILCNEGSENRCRLDMVSYISRERQEVAYDLLSNKGLPLSYNSMQLGFMSSFYGNGRDEVWLFTKQNGYLLDQNTFKVNENNTINNIRFLNPKSTIDIASFYPIDLDNGSIIVSKGGDIYCEDGSVGAAYAFPLNTDVFGNKPSFQVSKFIGVSTARPLAYGTNVIVYDITNKRFLSWSCFTPRQLNSIPNPETNLLFDYNKMENELIWMGGTAFNRGTVFSIMRNNDIYYLCAINNAQTQISQQYYKKISIPNFSRAQNFAFHPQFPYMYFSIDNEIYCYDYSQEVYKIVETLASNEIITILKFNSWENDITSFPLTYMDDDFIAMQNQLIVGSYLKEDEIHGGIMRMFKVDNTNNSLKKLKEYNGFAKIVDIKYRERRSK